MTVSGPRTSVAPPVPAGGHDAVGANGATTSAAMGPPSAVHEVKTLVLSRHPAIAVETSEPERLDAVLRAAAHDIPLVVFEWSVTKGLRRPGGEQPVYGTTEPLQALAAIGELTAESLFVLHDFAPHLAQPEVSRAFRDLLERFSTPGRLSTIVVEGTRVELPPEVEARTVRWHLAMPTRDEYRRAISAVVESLQAQRSATVELEPSDLDELSVALSGLTVNQARQAVAQVAVDDGRLTREDVGRIVDLKAKALRDDSPLEYFPVSDNAYELGGFDRLRKWLDRARTAAGPEAAELNLPAPKGVLLVGVQGCGKSLAAKVIAREWSRPLLKLDVGRLFDKYVGESERNFRRAIASAEGMAPVVLWIDEIEKALATTGGGDSDGGLGRRIFGSFLTWMAEKRDEVFVVATANDLSALPPELLRKGRFDEIFFVDLPTPEERQEILRIHLRLRNQDPAAFELDQVAAVTEGFSGAELEQVVISAALQALSDRRPLDTETLASEARSTVPLARTRREDVMRLREYARERFVPVS
jgi:ATPase family protein associated with various cellular activities (AAA)/AAA+ lid domain-containing protein